MASTEKTCELVFGFNQDVQTEIDACRANYPVGPSNFCLAESKLLDAGGREVRVLKKGDTYNLCITVLYTELVGDLEPEFVFNATFMDLMSCDTVKSLCFSCRGRLICDTTRLKLCMPFECNEDGVFSVALTIALHNSDLFDFQCFDFCFACHPSCVFPESHTHVKNPHAEHTETAGTHN